MKDFSALYKKMCDTAKEIQDVWPKYAEEWNCYCRKGDYKDGIAEELHLEGLKEEEKQAIYRENAWIPQSHELRDRFFCRYGLCSLAKDVSARFSEYLIKSRNDELMKYPFDQFELMNVVMLMFIMENYHVKIWDFAKGEWVGIKR